jgi:uncharacterized lipoprotein YmbA
MTVRRYAAAALLLSLVLATGCGFLKRPNNTFYALDTVAPAERRASLGGVPVGIDGLELPPGLDRRGIVIRAANHELDVRGTHQWASSLEDMVTHTLAFNLANRLPEGMVVLPGQAKPAAMRSIYVVMDELAPGPEPVFVLDARWTMTETGRAELTRHERITVNMPSMDSPEIVTAMNTALAQLADRIAAAL